MRNDNNKIEEEDEKNGINEEKMYTQLGLIIDRYQ